MATTTFTKEDIDQHYLLALRYGPSLFIEFLSKGNWFTLAAHARLIEDGVNGSPGGPEVWENALRRARQWVNPDAWASNAAGTAFKKVDEWHKDVADCGDVIRTVHYAAVITVIVQSVINN